MLPSAAHTCREVFEAVHVESATAVAGWDDSLSFGQAFHSVDHFSLERATVVLFRLLTGALTSCWQEIRWGVWYRYRRI